MAGEWVECSQLLTLMTPGLSSEPNMQYLEQGDVVWWTGYFDRWYATSALTKGEILSFIHVLDATPYAITISQYCHFE